MEETQVPQPKRRKTGCNIWFLAFILLVGYVLLVPYLRKNAQEAGRRLTCINNLKNIELALHNYHAAYGQFPPAYTVDESGKPLHSWRTLLLPFIERSDIYDNLKLDEPWDSLDNLAVYEECCPRLFQCPSCPELYPNPKTTYVMVTGPNCVSDGPHSCSLEDLQGKQENIIHVIESMDPVLWYEPKDLKAEEIDFKISDETSPGIGSCHPGIVVAAFCDGRVEVIDGSVDPEELRAMFEVPKDASWGAAMVELREKANH